MKSHSQTLWHILGAGAIGCLWASHLASYDRRVHLLLSPRRAAPKQGKVALRLQTPAGVCKSVAVDASSAQQLTAPINNLIVSTKATQVVDALQSVSLHFVPGTRIVLLLNGMGYQHAVLEAYPHCTVFAGASTDGAWLKKPFDVVQAGQGLTTLGTLGTKVRATEAITLVKDLQNPGLLLKSTSDIETVLLEKLMINAAINGLTALHKCRNGELLEIAPAHAQLQQLLRELQDVLLAANEKKLAAELPAKVHKVITQTANNYSSTYQDIKHQRQTEITFINGYVCQLGRKLGQTTPCNEEVVMAIKALEPQ